jgi:fumarate hydratase subunit alpha
MKAPRYVSADAITGKIVAAIGEMFWQTDPLLIKAIQISLESETDPLARDILKDIIRNSEIANQEKIPTCQDTGTLVVFVEYGTALHLGGADLRMVIETAAAQAWRRFSLRDSIVSDPLREREAVTMPLPVVLHTEMVPGDKLRFTMALKGGGAENMSTLKIFSPSASSDEIREFVVQAVVSAGGKPCPPLIVGVGIGGNFENCALLAKKALFRPLGEPNPQAAHAELERAILDGINSRGTGPMGLGGKTTALAVHVLTAPCHIASLPVAVNIQCHAHRHCEFVL